ncbi:MAG TPA: hypothetical protein VJZ71_05900 [Phycisphaerae bacterium]|nr:hypothetical protein [Phycisphaerae bacterium]
MPKNEKNRPVREIRYGSVKVLVWENETQNGSMHNVTVSRLYKDGEEWKETSGFHAEDLPILAKALNDAHSWVHEQAAAKKAS